MLSLFRCLFLYFWHVSLWLKHGLSTTFLPVFHWCPNPYPYDIVAQAAVVRDVRGSVSNVYSAGLGYNYGYNVYDRRFNDVALGYGGVVGLNAPVVGLGGIRGLNAPVVGFGGVYGLRK
ncbi:hypothetical protein CEXT_526651 [Caerostris extrusa]|uniref:Uncharacterized protein n=1 Tax=Caerostris extrusa TaxID=172846 RepID=A0AAV4M2L4_CAEEX|nr:hypothetical protein CEXT_526651 [Caerostris extrusa]